MGQDACTEVVYGIRKKPYSKLPWDKSDMEEDDWWFTHVHPFTPSVMPWTPNGGYAEGITNSSPEVRIWCDEKISHEKKYPKPYAVTGSGRRFEGDDNDIVIYVPSSEIGSDWGESTRLMKKRLWVNAEDLKKFLEFLEQNKIKYKSSNLGWWIVTSYG